MSYADDFIEYMIDTDFDRFFGFDCMEYSYERFDEFFRSDGEVPQWPTAEGEWVPLDKMTRAHMRDIVRLNEHGRLLSSVMAFPPWETPEGRLGERFAGVRRWEDAMRIMFADEVRRRIGEGIYWKAAHNEGRRKAAYDIVRSIGEHIGPAPDFPYPTADQSGFRACHDPDDWRQRPDIPKEYEGAQWARTMGRWHPVDENGKPFEPGTRNDRNANTL